MHITKIYITLYFKINIENKNLRASMARAKLAHAYASQSVNFVVCAHIFFFISFSVDKKMNGGGGGSDNDDEYECVWHKPHVPRQTGSENTAHTHRLCVFDYRARLVRAHFEIFIRVQLMNMHQ